jgi:hypothetical protein
MHVIYDQWSDVSEAAARNKARTGKKYDWY